MNLEREKKCYNALMRIYRDKGYSSLVLDEALKDETLGAEFITRLFYGVLEKDFTLEYIIAGLADSKPKLGVKVILKMGIYMLRFMNVADYAAIDKCVELAKTVGKSGVSGFVNAVLRKSVGFELPKKGEIENTRYLSITYNLPIWLVKKLLARYDENFIKELSEYEEFRTHIRLNERRVKVVDFERNLSKYQDLVSSKTAYGYYVTHNTLNLLKKDLNLSGKDYTVQSLASMIAVRFFSDLLKSDSSVLDVCAAPGGKAVYLSQLKNCRITAADLHLHRIELMNSYAERMGVELDTVLNDAVLMRDEWKDRFDCVICDVPCSGLGDLKSKPDILLNRTPEDIVNLTGTQKKILSVSSAYVKKGGYLVYSTCTILKSENEEIVEGFLNADRKFALLELPFNGQKVAFLNLLPQKDKTDGFFVAVMRRID